MQYPALVGGASAVSGELAAPIIQKALYGDRNIKDLTEDEKENLSALTQLAVGLTIASMGGDSSDITTGVNSSKNAIKNNRLATLEEQKRIDELAKGNEREKLLYQAAACALINCSAEFADDDPMKEVYQKLEELGNSNEL